MTLPTRASDLHIDRPTVSYQTIPKAMDCFRALLMKKIYRFHF